MNKSRLAWVTALLMYINSCNPLLAEDLENAHDDNPWYSLADIAVDEHLEFVFESASSTSHVITASDYNNVHLLDIHTNGDTTLLHTPENTLVMLENTEAWEQGINGDSKVGYPSLVQNVYGAGADGKFYLYYAIHDPNGGIAVAVGDNADGPFEKLAITDNRKPNSLVLPAPKTPLGLSHYSSPVVIWNKDEHLWFMYFHYYKNEWNSGAGHQKTALATSKNLAANKWTTWKDRSGQILSVLPVTKERWMNSQSSYHAILRLPSGLWVALLRGTGGFYENFSPKIWRQDSPKIGLAFSLDGRRWAQSANNPIDLKGNQSDEIRPLFLGYVKPGEYMIAYSILREGEQKPTVEYRVIELATGLASNEVSYGNWEPFDGAASVWRTDSSVHIFSGPVKYTFPLP